MSTAYEIPTSAQPQVFKIPINGATYTLTLKFNSFAGVWVLDIADVNGALLAGGIPLVCGSDLVEQLAYLGFNFALYTQTDHAPDAPPTYTNLGSTGHLFAVLP